MIITRNAKEIAEGLSSHPMISKKNGKVALAFSVAQENFVLCIFEKGNAEFTSTNYTIALKDYVDSSDKLTEVHDVLRQVNKILFPEKSKDDLYKIKKSREKKYEKLVKKKFKELIGKDKVNYIIKNNWIGFRRPEFCHQKEDEIKIIFLYKDGVGDDVIFCSIHYDLDTKKWHSGNCIDYPDKEFDSYDEMKNNLESLEDEIAGNGFTLTDLP